MSKGILNDRSLIQQQKSFRFANSFLGNLDANQNLNFLDNFYGLNISQKDVKRFEDFVKIAKLKTKGYSPTKISRLTNISKSTIDKWLFNYSLPPIVRIFQHSTQLGYQKNRQWLSINSTRGGLFTGPWILVPNKITTYNDLLLVINQLKPLRNICKRYKQFKSIDLEKKKPNLFAYLLGMLVGDASKSGIQRKHRTTRRISLSLTQAYKTNLQLGEFTSFCASYLGLRMNRIKDTPKGKENKNDFFRWNSQSSSLIEWIFNVCLGLDDHQLTTYDPINVNWILSAPEDFRTCFLQGIADSDGFVDLQACQVGIITHPNTKIIKKVLESLSVNSNKRIFPESLEGLMITIEDAYKLPVFNPFVKSYRFQLLEKLAKAKRIKGHWSEWLSDKVDFYLKSGFRGTQVVEKILNESNILIRTKQIYKRQRKI